MLLRQTLRFDQLGDARGRPVLFPRAVASCTKYKVFVSMSGLRHTLANRDRSSTSRPKSYQLELHSDTPALFNLSVINSATFVTLQAGFTTCLRAGGAVWMNSQKAKCSHSRP